MSLLMVLAVLVTMQTENKAEELYRQLEKKLTDAKMINVTFSGTHQSDLVKTLFSGTLKIPDAKSLKTEFKSSVDGKAEEPVVVTVDGPSITLGTQKVAAPPNFLETFRARLAKAGQYMQLRTALDGPHPPAGQPAVEQVRVGEFKLGKKEKVGGKDSQSIEYKIGIQGKEPSMLVTLWLDTKTNLPLKRVVQYQIGRVVKEGNSSFKTPTITIAESYDVFEVK